MIHNTPTVGTTADGKQAVSHARGGPHAPLEKPVGQSLTSLAPGEEGKTLWSTELERYDPSFASHWNEKYVFGFRSGNHVVLDAASGKVLREQPLYSGAHVWTFDSKTRRGRYRRRRGESRQGPPEHESGKYRDW